MNFLKNSFGDKQAYEHPLKLTTDTILNFYWLKFIDGVSQYYPIKLDFIEKYPEALNWRLLSQNENLDWNDEFLTKFRDKLRWTSVLRNRAIRWDYEKVEEFKKFIDIEGIGANPSSILDEQLLDKYGKKMTVVANHPMLTEELYSKYKFNVFHPYEDKRYSEKNVENLFLYEDDFRIGIDYDVYTMYIEPIVKKHSLEEIIEERFSTKQKYYELLPIQVDQFGLTPEFETAKNEIYRGSFDEKGLIDFNQKLVFKNGSLQEGKDRLLEVPRLSGFSFRTYLIISDNVKRILEKFHLPPYHFHEINFQPNNIRTAMKFYLFHLDYNRLMKDLDYTQEFFDEVNIDSIKKIYKNPNKFSSLEEIDEYIKIKLQEHRSDHTSYSINVLPQKFKVNSSFDIYSYSVHKKVIINEFVKNELEKNIPGQIKFIPFVVPAVEVNTDSYEDKRDREIKDVEITPSVYVISPEQKFYRSKMNRLKKVKGAIPELPEDEFLAIQQKRDIILTDKFKNFYRGKPELDGDFKLLDINKFYFANDISDRFPETYNAVTFAEDGCGDCLVILLEKNSDFLMRDTIYQFYHEDGTYGIFRESLELIQ